MPGQLMSAIRIVLASLGWLLTYPLFLLFEFKLQSADCASRCSMDSVEIDFIAASLMLLGIALVAQGRRWSHWLRWGAVPHAATVLYAVMYVPGHFLSTNIRGRHYCASFLSAPPGSMFYNPCFPGEAWHAWIWPAKCLCLAVLIAFAVWFARVGRIN